MELSFEGAEIAKGKTTNYASVGNHKVKVTEVVGGLSSQKQSPYVRITVQNEAGETCTQDYYTNGGAWNISKSAILTIIAAATGTDEATAKTKLVGMTTENIATKLATMLVGKQFGITLNGEWVNPTDTQKKSFVKSVFGSYLFAVPADQMNKLSTKPYIKGSADDREANNGGSTDSSVSIGVVKSEATAW